MQRIQQLSHKGEEILFFDLRGLDGEKAIVSFIEEMIAYLKAQDKPSLHLVNATDVLMSVSLVHAIGDRAEELKPFVIKSAVLGVTGVRRMLFNIFEKVFRVNIRAFSTEEEAKEWLVA